MNISRKTSTIISMAVSKIGFHTCVIWFVLITYSAVNTKPTTTTITKYNNHWILPPSRQESTTTSTPQTLSIWNLFNGFGLFDGKNKMIETLNPSELIKRVGILPEGEQKENDWIIPPSRTDLSQIQEHHNEKVSYIEAEHLEQESSENSIMSLKAIVSNVTKQLQDQIYNVRNTFVESFQSLVDYLSETPNSGVPFIIYNFLFNLSSENKPPKR